MVVAVVGETDGPVVVVLVAAMVDVVVAGVVVSSLQAPSRTPSIIMNAKNRIKVFSFFPPALTSNYDQRLIISSTRIPCTSFRYDA